MSKPKKAEEAAPVAEPKLETKAKAPRPAKASAKSEPAPHPDFGDLTPELIEWRQKHWPAARFDELYPATRLAAIAASNR